MLTVLAIVNKVFKENCDKKISFELSIFPECVVCIARRKNHSSGTVNSTQATKLMILTQGWQSQVNPKELE